MYVRRDKVTTRKVVDETLLVPVRADVEEMEFFYVLNEMGESIWEYLEKPRSLEDLVLMVEEEFEGAERDEIEGDVREFVDDLISHRLLRNA